MAYSNFYSLWLNFWHKAKSSWQIIWRYRANRWYFLVFLLCVSLLFLQAYGIYTNLSGSWLVLRYKIGFGASLIGKPVEIFYYPIAMLIFFILNFILAMIYSKLSNHRFIYNYIFSSSIVLTIFMSLYLMSVYLVNFK